MERGFRVEVHSFGFGIGPKSGSHLRPFVKEWVTVAKALDLEERIEYLADL
ncbi:MAG: hypothetical protein OXB88_03240 [Bacteriovoracales bacterium]|nr:hypothetical protein [Bacteriovoracales bacterium]